MLLLYPWDQEFRQVEEGNKPISNHYVQGRKTQKLYELLLDLY